MILTHSAAKVQVYRAPISHKKRLPILEKAGELIVDAFFNPFEYDISHLFWHRDKINKRGGYRKVRREQRESMTCKVGRYIMHYVNLATQTLGYFAKSNNEFHYYGYEHIAKELGANLSQIKRTMARFIKAGYVEVTPRKKMRSDGSWESLSPVIKISLRLFYDLGFDKNAIMFHIERAAERLEKEKRKVEQKNSEKKPALFDVAKKRSMKIKSNYMSEIHKILTKKLLINSS
jgi:hypothetical protein